LNKSKVKKRTARNILIEISDAYMFIRYIQDIVKTIIADNIS